jgi:hypothetical protein
MIGFNFAPSTASPLAVSGQLGDSQSYSNSSGTGTYLVTAYGFDCSNHVSASTFCAYTGNPSLSDATFDTDLYGFGSGNNNGGLGIYGNDTYGYVNEIPRTSFVQLDFSTVTNALQASGASIQWIKVSVSNINTGWNLFSSSTPGTLESSTGGQSIGDEGTNTSYTFSGSKLNTLLTENAGHAGFLGVTAAVNCDVELTGFTVDFIPGTSTPEPSTCLLMGLALVGMGVAGTRLRKRS